MVDREISSYEDNTNTKTAQTKSAENSETSKDKNTASGYFQYSMQDALHYVIVLGLALSAWALAHVTDISYFLENTVGLSAELVGFLMPLIAYFLKVFIQNNKK